MKKIYIIGAGGFGREVAWLIERINSVAPVWKLCGFIDDNPEKQGKRIDGYPVVGDCNFLRGCGEEVWVVCAIAAAAVRKKVVKRVTECGSARFATLIDPSALYSSSVSIGEGTIICEGTILTVDITIGKHIIIDYASTVGHDAVIKDFVTIYPSVNVSGCCIIEQGVEVGTGTQIIQGKKIGHETIVGAGSVVVKDLPCSCTAVGAPAKPIKYR